MILIFLTTIAILTLIIDWLQTRYIAKHPEKYSELNVILGPHPSVVAVNIYFMICIAIIGAVAYFATEPYGAVGCGLLAVFEILVTIRNYRFGVRFE